VKCLVGLLLAFGVIWAQDAPSSRVPASAQPQKDTERRLGLLATRASANFRSADSIEASLHARGHSLHPQIVALRLRIEAALDEAQKAVDHADPAAANEALDRAQALLQRFIQRLGGA
jgi:phage shock protein A